MERKDVEKSRRLRMKGLCLKLSSLVPAGHRRSSSSSSSSTSSNRDGVTQLDQLDGAAAYIGQLQASIDELKGRKKLAGGGGGGCCSSGEAAVGTAVAKAEALLLPVIEVRCQDATLDVVLASEAGRPFKLHEVIAAVEEEEGGEVVSASFSVVGDKIFYSIHAQARIGLEASRVFQRLHGLAAGAGASPTLTSC